MVVMPNETEPTHLPVTTLPEPSHPVPIKLDKAALGKLRKRRQDEQLAEAKAFQLVGSKILRINNKVLGKIGKEIEQMGVKRVAHGRIASAAENAGMSLVKCDQLIAEMQANNPALDPNVIVAMMRLQLDFNKQIIETGEAHLVADKQVTTSPAGNNLSIPFPVGQPMFVSVNPIPQKAIEETTPKP